jgi:anti-anti-sigma factor
MPMDVRVNSLCGTPLLEMRGDIDHSTCGAVESALAGALDAGHKVVLFDLRDVTYIDSGGLSVLFSGARRLRESGWLGLIDPNPDVRRLFEIVGLFADPSFRMFDDRQAAEAVLSAAPEVR